MCFINSPSGALSLLLAPPVFVELAAVSYRYVILLFWFLKIFLNVSHEEVKEWN
jgi:hypothetical protein